jgi:hypothetical protein
MLHRVNGGFFLALAVAGVGLGSTHCGGSSSNANQGPPTNLTYSVNPAAYPVGTAIAQNAPTSSGGAVTSYAVAPSLPAGLALDPATGDIAGTPTAPTAQATYTVTASNAAGNATAALVITVTNVAPSNLTYTSPAVYVVGTAVSNKPHSAGGPVASY